MNSTESIELMYVNEETTHKMRLTTSDHKTAYTNIMQKGTWLVKQKWENRENIIVICR